MATSGTKENTEELNGISLAKIKNIENIIIFLHLMLIETGRNANSPTSVIGVKSKLSSI